MRRQSTAGNWFVAGAGIAAAWLLAATAALPAQEMLGGRGRLSGKVQDGEKKPLAGVQVVVQSVESPASKVEAVTDTRGGFAVGGLRTGIWSVSASKGGFRSVNMQVEVRQLRSNPPLVLVLQSLESAVAQGSRLEAGDQLTRGNQLLESGKYAEARDVLEKFRADHPEAWQVGLQIGLCRIKEGELQKGEEELKKLLETIVATSGAYEKDAERAMQALAGLGEAAIRRNDPQAGMNLFRQALALSPTNEVLAYNVAEILFSNQKTDEAIPFYQMAIGIRKEWAKPYRKLGMALLNQGDYPPALEALRQFIALEPDSPAAAEARAIIEALEKAK